MQKFDNLGASLAEIDWEYQALKPFQKSFYKVNSFLSQPYSQEHPQVAAKSDEEIKAFREEKKINVKGENIPKPVSTFEESRFPKYIL